jgi:hypothetical protein
MAKRPDDIVALCVPCAKKRLCNPPVAAAVQAADNILDAIERNLIPRDIGVVYLKRHAELDDLYVSGANACGKWLMEALEARAEGRTVPGAPWGR